MRLHTLKTVPPLGFGWKFVQRSPACGHLESMQPSLGLWIFGACKMSSKLGWSSSPWCKSHLLAWQPEKQTMAFSRGCKARCDKSGADGPSTVHQSTKPKPILNPPLTQLDTNGNRANEG